MHPEVLKSYLRGESGQEQQREPGLHSGMSLAVFGHSLHISIYLEVVVGLYCLWCYCCRSMLLADHAPTAAGTQVLGEANPVVPSPEGL